MLVMKFGGSSVRSSARIRHVLDLVVKAHKRDRNLVVVFSAYQGVTDQLIATSKLAAAGDKKYLVGLRSLRKRHLDTLAELVPLRQRRSSAAFVRDRLADLTDVLHGVFYTKELTTRMLDYIMSFGEILSTFTIAEALKARRIPCGFVDSRTLIKTDDTFGNGKVKYDLTELTVRSYFRKHRGIQMACGFIASTTDNDTVTLGRGGSDFSASIFGAALGARDIEIWTDVDGVMTADPRKVPAAFSIDRMTYEEAMEMSHFGAKVIHPPTMQPALDHQIPIRIKNTFSPDFPGTVIGKRDPSAKFPIKGISSIDDISLLRIQGSGMVGTAGLGRRIFGALAAKQINVLMVTQASSEYSLCLAVLPRTAQAAKQAIEEDLRHEIRDRQIDQVLVENDLSVVAIVGENMRKTTGISARLFQALGKNGINVIAIAQGSSELNISTIVARTDEAKALNVLHDAFFLSGTKTLNVFLVGTGLIGATLLRKIARHRQTLLRNRSLEIRLQAVANSTSMVFDSSAMLPQHWQEKLAREGTPMNAAEFISRMKALNLPNSVFVDCTASQALVPHYEGILGSSVSIVTPNKKANAGPRALYEQLHRTALKHNVHFLYETNVGAGLPVINTINDLVAGGDRILRIDGVLSGTLSYLFNSFAEEMLFSDIVRDARKRGYTEPDPRDDLNGLDVGRKLLILAREAGYPLEFRNIRVKPLLPRSVLNARTLQEFFVKLRGVDAPYARTWKSAARNGNVLRYIASFADGKGEVSLQQVGPDHPCYSLSGSDILIALTTENCRDHPIVIRGPGAGADVTATGVFADIIRISHYQS